MVISAHNASQAITASMRMKLFRKTESLIAIVLLFLMAVVVVAAVIGLGYQIFASLISDTDHPLSYDELLSVYGLFLMVLIGLELMACIHMYLENNKIHAEMMLLVALTAVTRKIVILETSEMNPLTIIGIGFLVLVLSGGYYLIRKGQLVEVGSKGG